MTELNNQQEAENTGSEDTGKEQTQTPSPDTKTMSESEKDILINSLLESKRSANAEAKEYRLELDKYKEVDRAKQEEEMSALEIVKERDKTIANMTAESLQNKLDSKARTKLIGAGFDDKFVNAALPKDLTEENLDDKVKEFTKEFKDYVRKPESPQEEKPALNPFQSVHPKIKDTDPNAGTSATEKMADYIMKKT